MSSQEEVKIARPSNDDAREVRVIRALYSPESMRHPTHLSNQKRHSSSPHPSSTYQNTGVQTLPPANGDDFRLIHGREPSESDYAYRMGSAGIGRLTHDPRSNPYDLIHDAAYLAPLAPTRGMYTDAGFQTATHGSNRKALARAKVKASMTANKYRSAAAKAGYIIYAESRDEMIVHSEQFSEAVQLDAEGNLLVGTVESRSLPNIYGTAIGLVLSQPAIAPEVAEQGVEHLSKQTSFDILDGKASQDPYPSPSQSPTPSLQALTGQLQELVSSISALAPALTEKSAHAQSMIDNEHGNVEPGTNEFVVYDADAEDSRPNISRSSTKLSLGKRKLNRDDPCEASAKKHKASAKASPRNPPVSVIPLVVTPSSRLDQDRKALPTISISDRKTSLRAPDMPRTRPGDFGQEHTLNVAHTGTQSKVRSESERIAPRSAGASWMREQKSRHKLLSGQTIDTMYVAAGTETGELPEAQDRDSDRQVICELKSSRSNDESSMPSVPEAVSEAIDVSLSSKQKEMNAKNTEQPSLPSKRSFGEISIEPHDCRQTKRPPRTSFGTREQPWNSLEETSTRSGGHGSRGRPRPGDAYPQKPAVVNFTESDRTPSGRSGELRASRTSRIQRAPIAPYLPPAKRAKGQRSSKTDGKR